MAVILWRLVCCDNRNKANCQNIDENELLFDSLGPLSGFFGMQNRQNVKKQLKTKQFLT
jgi:hypothetical protein